MKSKALVKVMPPQGTKIAAHMREILEMVGENPSREGLIRTPERYEKALRFLTSGYDTSLEEIVNEAVFQVKVDEMVMVKDIEMFSLCEHHILPFFGHFIVGYIPEKMIIGASKIPRIVEVHMRRLQSQEHLAHDVADMIERILEPLGLAVWMGGMHMCMVMRGVEQESSFMETNVLRGNFLSDERTRHEFMSIVNRRGQHGPAMS